MLRGSGCYAWGAALAGLAGWVIITLALAVPAWAESRVLRLNWLSQRDRDVTVTEIELTETQIIVTIQVRNRSLRTIQPRIYPPGHQLSFYILENATGRRHYLAGSQGLAVEPAYTPLAPGRSVTFKLFFSRIPLASFSLMEGEPSLRPGSGYIFWDFLNIDLAKYEKDFKSADRPPPRPDHTWSQPPAPPVTASKPAPPQEPLKSFDNPPGKK